MEMDVWHQCLGMAVERQEAAGVWPGGNKIFIPSRKSGIKKAASIGVNATRVLNFQFSGDRSFRHHDSATTIREGEVKPGVRSSQAAARQSFPKKECTW